jgi:hypothetical protein
MGVALTPREPSELDTSCTTPSLIPTVNGNTVRLRTDNCPQPRKLDHGLALEALTRSAQQF